MILNATLVFSRWCQISAISGDTSYDRDEQIGINSLPLSFVVTVSQFVVVIVCVCCVRTNKGKHKGNKISHRYRRDLCSCFNFVSVRLIPFCSHVCSR